MLGTDWKRFFGHLRSANHADARPANLDVVVATFQVASSRRRSQALRVVASDVEAADPVAAPFAVGATFAAPALVGAFAGAAPFARSFSEGFAHQHRVQAETVATAIRIGDPASYERAVRAIRTTNGVVIAVSDEEILEAKAVVDASGVGCEPASAASVAGLRRLVAQGTIGKSERVAAVLTGHILKDPGLLISYHQQTDPPPPRANRPIEIEPSLSEVERFLPS